MVQCQVQIQTFQCRRQNFIHFSTHSRVKLNSRQSVNVSYLPTDCKIKFCFLVSRQISPQWDHTSATPIKSNSVDSTFFRQSTTKCLTILFSTKRTKCLVLKSMFSNEYTSSSNPVANTIIIYTRIYPKVQWSPFITTTRAHIYTHNCDKSNFSVQISPLEIITYDLIAMNMSKSWALSFGWFFCHSFATRDSVSTIDERVFLWIDWVFMNQPMCSKEAWSHIGYMTNELVRLNRSLHQRQKRTPFIRFGGNILSTTFWVQHTRNKRMNKVKMSSALD